MKLRRTKTMANEKIDLEALKADIEKVKNAESREEIDEIMAKYDDAIKAMEKDLKTRSDIDASSVKQNGKSGRYAGKYVITQGGDDLYRFKLLASNGQSLINSEGYTTEAGCRKGIDTIKKNVTEGRIKIDSDKHDLYFFTLVTKQNRILAQSASYKSKDAATRASESFVKFALTENIIFDENVDKDVSSVEKVDVEYENKDGGTYTVEQDDHGFIYVLKASNRVKIVTSQDYSSASTAKEAFLRFKEAVYDGEWQIVKDKSDNFQFKLYKNRRLVVAGELYTSKDQVKNTIASIKSFAKNATWEETEKNPEE